MDPPPDMRVIIADDEPLARERLRSFLSEEADVQIVAECNNGAEAVKAVQKHQPDLLLLDIQMPRMNGFEVLQALDRLPAVIFSTAHDEHAIQAFEVNALDYLLKPCTAQRFKKALQRARDELQRNAGGAAVAPNLANLIAQLRAGAAPGGGERILVKSPDRIVFLKPEEVDHIEAAGNYVILHTGKDRHILRETMAAMESRLTCAGFMRINRSIIVNLSRVREVQPLPGGIFSLVLKNGTRLDMTCSLRDLRARLSQA
jgi:two-component system LytT family response regulator